MLPLSRFGDVARYDAFPPMPEADLPSPDALGEIVFFHPVLDSDRYVLSLLRSSRFVDFLSVRSAFHRALARAERRPSTSTVLKAGLRRFRDALRTRCRHAAIRLFGTLVADPPKQTGGSSAVGLPRSCVPDEVSGR